MRGTLWMSLGLLGLASCGWNNLPNQSEAWFDQPLWDAQGVLPTDDGLYVRLPYAGKLVLVKTGGDATEVDVGEGRVERIESSPDGTALLAFVERYTCDVGDKELKKVDRIEDCHSDKLEIETEIDIVVGGSVDGAALDIDNHYNALEWSPTGAYAIAYLDPAREANISGIINLESVLVIDIATRTGTPVDVGFRASQILFDEVNERAVVLSKSQVAVVDLSTEEPYRDVTFPLTLDPDQAVVPVGVALTPDGQYALISVQGEGDLYVLDLENKSVNMVSLSANPSAMNVDSDSDRTVIVYGNGAVADILEHDYFDIETVTLDEPMSEILDGTGFALLYNPSGSRHDVYHLDLETGNLVEFRLENPILQLQMAPTEEYAIALTRAEGGSSGDAYDARPGMEILDLRPDAEGRVRGHSTAYMLEDPGVGLAFTATDTALYALVLQQNQDYLYQQDLYTAGELIVELSAPPVAIGAMPDGRFYITHEAGLGMVSFYDPLGGTAEEPGSTTEAAGFATIGLLDETEVVNEGGE